MASSPAHRARPATAPSSTRHRQRRAPRSNRGSPGAEYDGGRGSAPGGPSSGVVGSTMGPMWVPPAVGGVVPPRLDVGNPAFAFSFRTQRTVGSSPLHVTGAAAGGDSPPGTAGAYPSAVMPGQQSMRQTPYFAPPLHGMYQNSTSPVYSPQRRGRTGMPSSIRAVSPWGPPGPATGLPPTPETVVLGKARRAGSTSPPSTGGGRHGSQKWASAQGGGVTRSRPISASPARAHTTRHGKLGGPSRGRTRSKSFNRLGIGPAAATRGPRRRQRRTVAHDMHSPVKSIAARHLPGKPGVYSRTRHVPVGGEAALATMVGSPPPQAREPNPDAWVYAADVAADSAYPKGLPSAGPRGPLAAPKHSPPRGHAFLGVAVDAHWEATFADNGNHTASAGAVVAGSGASPFVWTAAHVSPTAATLTSKWKAPPPVAGSGTRGLGISGRGGGVTPGSLLAAQSTKRTHLAIVDPVAVGVDDLPPSLGGRSRSKTRGKRPRGQAHTIALKL